jgi:hypothetical protein
MRNQVRFCLDKDRHGEIVKPSHVALRRTVIDPKYDSGEKKRTRCESCCTYTATPARRLSFCKTLRGIPLLGGCREAGFSGTSVAATFSSHRFYYNFAEITIITPPLTRILDRLIGKGISCDGSYYHMMIARPKQPKRRPGDDPILYKVEAYPLPFSFFFLA